jgi:methyl-accepting chemotaxis protein
MNLKNLSIKAQLACGFGLLSAGILAISLMSLKALHDADVKFETHVKDISQREGLASGVRSATFRRAIAARNLLLVTDPADIEIEKQAVTKAHEDTQTRLTALKDSLKSSSDHSDTDEKLVAEIDRVETAYTTVALAVVKLTLEGKKAEATEKLIRECRPLLVSLRAATDAYVKYAEDLTARSLEAERTDYAKARWILLTSSAMGLLAALGAGFLITRNLMNSLGAEPANLGATVKRVADGDLGTIAGAVTAPHGSVLASMGQMQGNLVGLIDKVRVAADSVSNASAEIATGNLDLSQRTEQQASALEETAASMEQLGSTVRQNADNARQANQLAMGASTVAIKGGEVVSQVVTTMKGINDSSKKIADIISVIDGIAFQTNILALNAAVEAARAGEQGRGFAVVASEVRSLAQRSAEAAKEIKGLIGASVERVEQGTTLVDQAGVTMTEIVTAIKRVTDIMGEISAASTEQSAGVAQVGEAISQMDKATQQNAALVEESAAAAEGLKAQAQQMVQAVAVFKLNSQTELVQAMTSGAQAKAKQPKGDVPVLSREVAAITTDRRGPDRAKNVTRPDFKAHSAAPVSAPVAKTGTDDWESF